MSFFIPEALSAFAAAGAALQALYQWRRRAVGNARVLIMEIEENYTYLDMVVFDEVPLDKVIQDLSVSEYKRLAGEGFDFKRLKRNKIQDDPSFEGTKMANWAGKSTAELIDSIYEKLTDLKIRYPHNYNNPKYRWNVRVQNIIKLIWLLLKHVGSDCAN
jgi:hypothetical protein